MEIFKLKRSSFLLVLLGSLAGCVATPLPTRSLENLPARSENFANVYFVREAVYFGNAVWPAILLNGQRVAPLPNGTFSMVKLKPGIYQVTMEKEQWTSGPWSGTTTIEVQPGKNYYLLLQLLYRNTSGLVMAGAAPIVTREAVSEGQRWVHLEEAVGTTLVKNLPFVDPFVVMAP